MTKLGGEKTTEKSDKQIHNAGAACETILKHNKGMQDRGHKMNDELVYREFFNPRLRHRRLFLGGYIQARLQSSRMKSEG